MANFTDNERQNIISYELTKYGEVRTTLFENNESSVMYSFCREHFPQYNDRTIIYITDTYIQCCNLKSNGEDLSKRPFNEKFLDLVQKSTLESLRLKNRDEFLQFDAVAHERAKEDIGITDEEIEAAQYSDDKDLIDKEKAYQLCFNYYLCEFFENRRMIKNRISSTPETTSNTTSDSIDKNKKSLIYAFIVVLIAIFAILPYDIVSNNNHVRGYYGYSFGIPATKGVYSHPEIRWQQVGIEIFFLSAISSIIYLKKFK